MLPIHFAPLQGYTDCVYRTLHARLAGGVDTYYTPFIRWEKGDVRGKDVRDILPENNIGTHLIPQIICGTTDDFNRLSDIIQEQGWREIDINMGCPAPMQTKLLRGSGILNHPEIVEGLMAEAEKRPDVHYSVKMRLGFESADDWKNLLPILNSTHLSHLTIHPRIGKQMYKGEVDMECFSAIYEQCQIPLVYNGDLTTIEQIRQVEATFPRLSGIMLGRGLLAIPTLAREYCDEAEWTPGQRRQVVLAMHKEMLEFCKEKYKVDSQILLHIHAFWEYQQPHLDKKVFKRIMKAGSMRNYLEAVGQV